MGYTIKDLLESDKFPAMHLISGRAGIDREIGKPRLIEGGRYGKIPGGGVKFL